MTSDLMNTNFPVELLFETSLQRASIGILMGFGTQEITDSVKAEQDRPTQRDRQVIS